jgi:hypothetical protein
MYAITVAQLIDDNKIEVRGLGFVELVTVSQVLLGF